MGRMIVVLGLMIGAGIAPAVLGRGPSVPNLADGVGVVNLSRLLKESPNLSGKLSELEKWMAVKQKEIDDEEKRIQSLEENLALYDKSSEDFQKEKNRLDLEKLKLNQFVKGLERQKGQRLVEINAQSYDEFARAAEQVSVARGLSLVLQMGPSPVGARSEDEFLARLVRRNILWADGALDITDEVLKILAE